MKKNKQDIIDENEQLRVDIERLRKYELTRASETTEMRLEIDRLKVDNAILARQNGELALKLEKAGER